MKLLQMDEKQLKNEFKMNEFLLTKKFVPNFAKFFHSLKVIFPFSNTWPRKKIVGSQWQ